MKSYSSRMARRLPAAGLKYLVLAFAVIVICMSLMEPRHVKLIYEQPYQSSAVER